MANYKTTFSGNALRDLESAKTKFGLSDDEINQGLDAFGKWHQQRFGSGFDPGTSSYQAIVNGAVQNALNQRAIPDFYTNSRYGPSWYEGGGPLWTALSYADSPERIRAHTVDAVKTMLNNEMQWSKEEGSMFTGPRSFFGGNLGAGFGGTNVWTAEDIDKIANMTADAGKSESDLRQAIQSIKSAHPNDTVWWGPSGYINALSQSWGLDGSKYIDQAKAQQESNYTSNIGNNFQASQGRDWVDDALKLGGMAAGLWGAGAGLSSLLSGAGSALGAGADIIGSDFAAGVGGSLGGVPADVAMSAATAGGTTAPTWTSGADLSTNLDVGNFVPAEAAGGTITGSGGPAIDPGGTTLTGTPSSTGGNMFDWGDPSTWGDNPFGVPDAGTGGSVIDAPYGPGIGDGALPYGPGIGDGVNLPYGPGINDGATIPTSTSGLPDWLKNMPSSPIKSALSALFGGGSGTGTNSGSLAGLLGTGLGGLLDYMGTSKTADNLKAIADRSWAAGQPYRDRANAAMTPGFDIKSIPGLSSAMDTATETYLRKLSATNGNPAGIGAAPSQTEAFVLGNVALPAWQNYFNANSNAGGLSSLSAQANSTATQAAGAEGGVYGSLGTTANKMFNPDPYNSNQVIRSLFGLAG